MTFTTEHDHNTNHIKQAITSALHSVDNFNAIQIRRFPHHKPLSDFEELLVIFPA